MIVGIGLDVVSVARFSRALQRTPKLVNTLLTHREQHSHGGQRRSVESLAARFAAKEAVAKVLGTPPRMEWHDCQILTELSGQPYLVVTGTVEAEAHRLGVTAWHLSITHDGDMAAAVVIAESSCA